MMKKLTVAIHQPNYLPWAGYFYKMLRSQIFVFLDDVQYSKNGFINRNRIKGSQGVQWLTVPVNASTSLLINEVSISDRRWSSKHMKTLDACYKKAAYYELYRPRLAELLETPYTKLSELNLALLTQIAEWFGISTEMRKSSELDITGATDERIISIVKKVGGTAYFSGFGGEAYQNRQKFSDAGIVLEYSDFSLPRYSQLWGTYEANLSAIDLLFNEGEHAAEILRNSGRTNGNSDGN